MILRLDECGGLWEKLLSGVWCHSGSFALGIVDGHGCW